jgi:murein L,D-transpeptidase YafK
MKLLCVSLSALLLCSCSQNETPEIVETPPQSEITDERVLETGRLSDSAPDEKASSEAIKAINNASKDLMPGQNENKKPLPKLQKPSLVVKKKARLLQVFDNGKFVRTYKIALGFAPSGDTAVEGDAKTPEG